MPNYDPDDEKIAGSNGLNGHGYKFVIYPKNPLETRRFSLDFCAIFFYNNATLGLGGDDGGRIDRCSVRKGRNR